MFAFLLSGGLAGLAGICEVASTVGQLQPTISPGYGFTAIIVAFLGRLNPVGVIIAGLILALSYMGGEAAQVTLGISDKIAKVFQGILLFFILACDTFILYRLRLLPRQARARTGSGGVEPWTFFRLSFSPSSPPPRPCSSPVWARRLSNARAFSILESRA